ncbi:hypothetical protein KUTeg_016233 [Tegillarca granosa]|uniref:CABIT domain-containing protein n=1 Tax=Tegillarca granosa TaxID=220873 RepID=A0ABQ9EK93_TEGGR|nr:hypothetical protein KUTeg_016233 [Tegillarca granosa]
MAGYPDDEYIWSPETLSLKDIVDRGELPTIVRVTDGIYTTNESETFSNGDLLKLDFVKTIGKVSARIVSSRFDDTGQFIEEDKYGYLKSKGDILIPLGYSGKVQIARTEGFKRYQTVKQLLEDFPRFVRVDKPITAFTLNNQCITISSGSKLELKKQSQSNRLLCSYNGEDILLDCRSNGVFVALADETFYTLNEIVNTFPLPQFVRFVDIEFKKVMTESLDEALENFMQYSGPLQLLYTTQQKVVVGHHKQATRAKQNSKFCRRALAILPLDNKNVCEIQCQIPIYSENSDEYQLLVARSFEDTNTDALEGGLYLEFAKNPKIHLIESINELLGPSAQQDDKPPPIPPRTWLDKTVELPRRPAPLPPRDSNYDIDEDDVYEISDIKPPTSGKEQGLKGSPEVKPKSEKNCKLMEGNYTSELVIADLSFQNQREKHLSTVPELVIK